MRHEYYDYNKEQLLANPKIPMEVMADKPTVFRAIAREMADEIKARNAAGTKTVFICPVGPIGQYPYFVDIVNSEGISLKNCWFINMDEYLDDDKQWIPMDHPLSFRGFMNRTVYTKINPELNVPEEQRVFPDPNNLSYIPNLIQQLGGVDVCFGGIGINGHLAFNEAQDELTPEAFAALHTRVLPISRETRVANAIGDLNGAIDAMPKKCITIGMAEILSAKKLRLGVFRDWHRAVVRQAAYGEVSAHFPATLAQKHPDAMIYVNANAAKQPF